jgi:hypothetical protein
VSKYVEEHPDCVVEEQPIEMPEMPRNPTDDRLADIEDALVELAGMIAEKE